MNLLTQLLDVVEYQIIYDGQRLVVVIVPRAGAAIRATEEKVAALLRRVLEQLGAAPPAIDVRTVSAIPREAGPGAKVKLVKVVGDPPGAWAHG